MYERALTLTVISHQTFRKNSLFIYALIWLLFDSYLTLISVISMRLYLWTQCIFDVCSSWLVSKLSNRADSGAISDWSALSAGVGGCGWSSAMWHIQSHSLFPCSYCDKWQHLWITSSLYVSLPADPPLLHSFLVSIVALFVFLLSRTSSTSKIPPPPTVSVFLPRFLTPLSKLKSILYSVWLLPASLTDCLYTHRHKDRLSLLCLI